MDTENFILKRNELYRRMEARRESLASHPGWSWGRVLGKSLLTMVKVALPVGAVEAEAWVPKILMGVAAPALLAFIRSKTRDVLPKKSAFSRIAKYIPFLKAFA